MPRQMKPPRLSKKAAATIAVAAAAAAKNLPSRAQGRLRNKTKETRALSKKLDNMIETKVDGLQSYIAQPSAAASPVPGTANAGQIVNFHLGPGPSLPTAWNGTWQSLDGIPNSTGTGSQERVGDYIYLKRTTVNMQIDLVPDPTAAVSNAPWEFRVVVGKSNRKYNPAGVSPNPNASLLISPSAANRGLGSNVDERLLMLSPPNRRNFTIKRDMKFILEANHASGSTLGTAPTGHYGCTKQLQFTLPHSKKVRFDSNGNPTNYDYHYFIIVYGRPIGGASGSRWNVTATGSTSYNDN